MPKLDRALFISLVVAILAALGYFGYLVATPNPGEKFTEFYILGPQGKAENYPQQVLEGTNADVIVGVVNHEQQPARYRVEITINDVRIKEVDIGTLAHQQKWEKEISFFVAQSLGEKQKVEFWLYRDNETEPYLQDPLRLYIDIRPSD
ncbi:MAG: DUF1616 domain-containing protein [Dehalococcoidia bacterium]|nr:DUF1616 domain-containing protein [Dehalococcoidia bacterium]